VISALIRLRRALLAREPARFDISLARGTARFDCTPRPPVRSSKRGLSLVCFASSLCALALCLGAGPASTKLMNVSEIRAGMRGYGLSVFRGTEPERFDIEVIDVLSNFRPDQDLVLIKTPHPVLDHAGSVAGMSGSPIYIDGRLIGAYAYGWSFGKDPIAGVTPIGNMLRELDRPLQPPAPWLKPLPAQARAAAKPSVAPAHHDAFHMLAEARRALPSEHATLRPVSTPLFVGGMPARVSEVLREHLAPLGLQVLEGVGGGATRSADPAASKYVDGGAIAVTLLRGDIQATGVGTVTHVDGKRLIAFGHPMLDAGELRLPTATARVLHILASERSSFKIAEAVKPLGALVHDRQSTIVIDTDVQAEAIPVRIKLRGAPAGMRGEWNVHAASHRLLTSALVASALSSALGAVSNDMSEMMFRAESVVHLRKHGEQRVVDEGYAPLGFAQPSALGQLRLFDMIDLSFANGYETDAIERIDVTIDVRFGREILELVGVRLSDSELDPGEPARVVLTLRPFAGEPEQRVLEVPLSSTLAGEQLELEFMPGHMARLEQPVAQSLADLLQIVRTRLPSTSLVVSVQRKGRGVSVASHVLHNLPASAVDLISPSRDTARTPAFISEERRVIPLGRVLTGQAKLALEIRKEK
jgi:hypothetical protein